MYYGLRKQKRKGRKEEEDNKKKLSRCVGMVTWQVELLMTETVALSWKVDVAVSPFPLLLYWQFGVENPELQTKPRMQQESRTTREKQQESEARKRVYNLER